MSNYVQHIIMRLLCSNPPPTTINIILNKLIFCRKNKKKYLLIAIFLFFLSFYNLFAQWECPNNIPPLEIPWNEDCCIHSFYCPTNQKMCDFEICYCWRETGISRPFIELYGKSINIVDPTCCDYNFNIAEKEDMMYSAMDYIIKNNPNNLPWTYPICEPECVDVEPLFYIYFAGCQLDDPFTVCPVIDTYCKNELFVCRNIQGTVIICNVIQSIIGPPCQPPCNHLFCPKLYP